MLTNSRTPNSRTLPCLHLALQELISRGHGTPRHNQVSLVRGQPISSLLPAGAKYDFCEVGLMFFSTGLARILAYICPALSRKCDDAVLRLTVLDRSVREDSVSGWDSLGLPAGTNDCGSARGDTGISSGNPFTWAPNGPDRASPTCSRGASRVGEPTGVGCSLTM